MRTVSVPLAANICVVLEVRVSARACWGVGGSPREPGCTRGAPSSAGVAGVPGRVHGPGRGRHGTPARAGEGSSPGDGQVGAAQPGVGFGGEVSGGGDRTHRGRRRGCPRARGRRAAWRLRVAGKVPGSGGRPAPRRAGPPWCALGPGRRRLTSGLRRPQTPRPPFPARYGLAAQLRPLPLARRTWPGPGSSPRRAPAQPRLRVASARPAGRLRLRDSSLPRKATPLGAVAAAPPPSHSLPPAQRRRRRRDLPLDLSSKFCPGWDF